jgi:hypothetical protein
MRAGEPELDAAGRAAIVAEWKRLAAEPPPTNPRPYGCATFLVAAVLLLGLPRLLELIGLKLPQPLGAVLLVILVLALAAGFFVGIFVGSGVYGRACARAQEALAWLAANPESKDAEARRHNAVALIFNTVVWDGPTVSTTIAPAQSRQRLGANLPYVLAVERVLVAELKIPAILAERSGTQ